MAARRRIRACQRGNDRLRRFKKVCLWRNEWGANQADSSQTAHMCQARRRVRSITALSQELVVRGMGRPMVYRAAPSCASASEVLRLRPICVFVLRIVLTQIIVAADTLGEPTHNLAVVFTHPRSGPARKLSLNPP